MWLDGCQSKCERPAVAYPSYASGPGIHRPYAIGRAPEVCAPSTVRYGSVACAWDVTSTTMPSRQGISTHGTNGGRAVADNVTSTRSPSGLLAMTVRSANDPVTAAGMASNCVRSEERRVGKERRVGRGRGL